MTGTDIGNYGNFGPQDPNTSVNAPGSPTPVGDVDESPSPFSTSSIQQSELEALVFMLLANLPILQFPTGFENGKDAGIAGIAGATALSIETKKHEIISKMWETYIENIREVAESLKKEDIRQEQEDRDKPGPKSSVEYFSFLMALSVNRRAEELEGPSINPLAAQFTQAYNHWLVNPLDSSSSTQAIGGYPSSSFVAGCVACNPDFIRNAIGVDGAFIGIQLSSSPVADALFAVGPTSGLPGDYQAAAALVAALLNGGAIYKATAETVASAGGTKPVYDLNFAINYAKEVMAIVTKKLEGGDPSNIEQGSQDAMIRLMLSAMALNMVYRAAYGGMQSHEFADLLNGNTADLPPEIKKLIDQLVALVNGFLPIDPKTRAETIARLMEYVDSKDSVDSMLNTSRLFSSLLQTDDLDNQRILSVKN